jgi:hypothetical protein
VPRRKNASAHRNYRWRCLRVFGAALGNADNAGAHQPLISGAVVLSTALIFNRADAT